MTAAAPPLVCRGNTLAARAALHAMLQNSLPGSAPGSVRTTMTMTTSSNSLAASHSQQQPLSQHWCHSRPGPCASQAAGSRGRLAGPAHGLAPARASAAAGRRIPQRHAVLRQRVGAHRTGQHRLGARRTHLHRSAVDTAAGSEVMGTCQKARVKLQRSLVTRAAAHQLALPRLRCACWPWQQAAWQQA
jgi:hypothetical protein